MSVVKYLTVVMLLFGSAGIVLSQTSTPPFILQFVNAEAENRSMPNSAQDGPVQVTFYLEGKFPHMGNTGFWHEWQGHSIAEIPTKVRDTAALSFSGFVYERGCALQYVAVEGLNATAMSSMEVPCILKQPVRVRAVIPNLDEAGAGGFVAEVSYRALRKHWIEADQTWSYTIVHFRVGSFPVSEDKSMTMDLPDFGNDPTVTAHLNGGYYEIWIHMDHSAHPIGYIQMPHDEPARGRFLPSSSRYPDPVVLQFTTNNHSVWK